VMAAKASTLGVDAAGRVDFCEGDGRANSACRHAACTIV
jgi:hypothetical protein